MNAVDRIDAAGSGANQGHSEAEHVRRPDAAFVSLTGRGCRAERLQSCTTRTAPSPESDQPWTLPCGSDSLYPCDVISTNSTLS
jgi:hypothetical protein